MKIASIISLAALVGCSTPEVVKITHDKHGSLVVHHIRRTPHGIKDRTDHLALMTPAQFETYQTGREPDGHGGMRESGQWYRIVQDSEWNTNLPEKGHKKIHPDNPMRPPNYTPPPQSQQISDAVESAHQAKDKLDAETNKIDQQLANDNALKGQLQTDTDEITELRRQLQEGMSMSSHAQPTPPPTNDTFQLPGDTMATKQP